jgi:hypothetical protein
MKNFRRLCFAIVLAAMLSVSAFAGETQTPPCADPGQLETPPGETQTPPCAANRDFEEPSSDGITQMSGYDTTGEVVATTTDTVLWLIQTVL